MFSSVHGRRRIRRRFDDAGMGIVEVVVALTVFMIISVGVAQAIVTTIKFSADQRARTVALNLAAQAIDDARGTSDVFDLQDTPANPTPTVIDGVSYTVNRDVSWVDASGADISCNGGSQNLQLKRVNIDVTWSGQDAASGDVHSDTVLAPGSAINDSTKGTILISARRADGTPATGATVTVTAVSGGAVTPSTQPDPIDAAGCSYALKVAPGTYSIVLGQPAGYSTYLSDQQVATPSLSRTVTAGGTTSAAFAYDQAATLALSYSSGTALKASNNQIVISTTDSDFAFSGSPSSISVFPTSYSPPVAGAYVAPVGNSVGCTSPDPGAWVAGAVSGTNMAAGYRGDAIGPAAGASAAAVVRMGVVQLVSPFTSGSARYVKIVSQTPISGSGDPGCSSTMTYTFGQVLPANGTIQIAVPYGTWSIYTGTSASNVATQLATTSVTVVSNAGPTISSSSAVTVDPRSVSP